MAVTKIKVALLTNVPAPYRVPVWRRLAQMPDIDLELIFCAKPHIDKQTDLSDYGFKMHFLTANYVIMQRRFMHIDTQIWSLLNQVQPDVLITTGYIPTFLFGFFWALKHKVAHIVMTDGTKNSEAVLTTIHRLVRRFVFKHSQAFIGACEGSRALYRDYDIPDEKIYLSYLCADNENFLTTRASKNSDFIFCGRFIAHKQPLFALQVAKEVAIRLGRKTSISFVGQGDLETELQSYAEQIKQWVDCYFPGYATQSELPQRYAEAKIHLFPSEWDPWGVVANEACASGLPTIVSPFPGVVGELLIDGYNAYVCDLNLELWTEAAVKLLNEDALYQTFSTNSRLSVEKYNYDNSALGLFNAIKHAFSISKRIYK